MAKINETAQAMYNKPSKQTNKKKVISVIKESDVLSHILYIHI